MALVKETQGKLSLLVNSGMKQDLFAQMQLYIQVSCIQRIYYILKFGTRMQINSAIQIDTTVYHHIPGTVCLIGHGSIGKGFITLFKRHFTYQKFIIIDPIDKPQEGICDRFIQIALTKENYIQTLDEVFPENKGFCVNLSVGTSSKEMMVYCQSRNILYIDTVKEQWQGFYADPSLDVSIRSNYGLRQSLREFVLSKKHKTTAVSCCGANPGMVSWFVKKALLDIVEQTKYELKQEPKTREEWGRLMMNLGVKGIHIAERDTQRSSEIRKTGQFWNTWSVDGFISEGFHQPSQIGWGTHEKWMPPNAQHHKFGPQYGIYLMQPGMNTTIKSWCPTPGPQLSFMVTHDESLSIADYYSVTENGKVIYRPTCNYAYHPCEDAVSSCFDLLGAGEVPTPDKWKIIDPEIIQGIDQLGVLLYGHSKNAYWYGSRLDIDRTRKLIDCQNATGLQVSSAVIAGMVWALENPESGLVEADEMDYKRCLQVQRQYLQPLMGVYTDWNPLKNRSNQFEERAFDMQDAWQFKNIITHK